MSLVGKRKTIKEADFRAKASSSKLKLVCVSLSVGGLELGFTSEFALKLEYTGFKI